MLPILCMLMRDQRENLEDISDYIKVILSLSFLFTIVVDGLGTLVDKAKYCYLLKSFVVGRDGVVSQLQFADDTLFSWMLKRLGSRI